MKLTDKSDHLAYLDLYDVQVTPPEARVLLGLIARIKPAQILAGEALILNNLTKQLEKIANE